MLECRHLNESIDGAKTLLCKLYEGRTGAGIGYVGGPMGSALTAGVKLGRHIRQRVLSAGGQNHIGTVAQGTAGALSSESNTDAGHDHGLSVKKHAPSSIGFRMGLHLWGCRPV